MMDKKIRYCIFCGMKNDVDRTNCTSCRKPLHPNELLLAEYLKKEAKEQLGGKVEDTIFEKLKVFLLAHLYGIAMSVAVVFTAASAVSAWTASSVPEDAVHIQTPPAASALGYLVSKDAPETAGEETEAFFSEETEAEQGSGVESRKPAYDDFSEQLQTIANHVSLWNLDNNPYSSLRKSYAVTDLDHNGRLEVISVTYGGTGYFEAFTVYEINQTRDGLELCFDNISDDSLPQPDVMVDSLTTYENDGIYCYPFTDFLRSGAWERYYSTQCLVLQDGQVKIRQIATRAEITPMSNPDQTLLKYYDAEGNQIEEEEYNQLMGDFSGEGGRTGFRWFGLNDGGSLGELLENSWQGFSYETEPET